MTSNLLEEAKSSEEWLLKVRRHLHAHPERSFQEHGTARFVEEELLRIGPMTVRTGVGKTGVVALIEGRPGPCVALRADMDALPISEETGLPYASRNEGVMHACGHDVHVTCLLGAARLLWARRKELRGSVKLIFQPAEELTLGARAMIEDGVMESPKVEMIFGLHVNPEVEAGKVAVRSGPIMASTDSFDVEVRGRGGHGAMPHRSADPILAASAVVLNLQSVVSRNVDPLKPAVLSVCTFHGGSAHNIIPERVELGGTVRTMDEGVRDLMEARILEIARSTAEALGCSASVIYHRLLPPTVNSPRAASIAAEAAREVLGEEGVEEANPVMGAEDFSLFARAVPGCFLWLGVRNERIDAVHPWHSPRFKVDEGCLAVGASVMAGCALKALTALSPSR